MSEDKPEEPTEVVEEPCEEVIVKKRMTTNACQPNDMGNEQNAVVQPLLTGLFVFRMKLVYLAIIYAYIKNVSKCLQSMIGK